MAGGPLDAVWARRAALLMSAIAIGSATSIACGGEEPPPPEPRHPVTTVVHRLQERFAARDYRGVCKLMTRGAQIQAGEVAHSDPTTCPRDVRRVFGLIGAGGGWLDGDPPRVAAVRTRGRSATVTLVSGDWRASVPFVEGSNRWKLGGFFGMRTSQLERIEKQMPREPFPPPAEGLVEVSDGDGRPCPRTSDARYPRITGGCVVHVTDKSAPVEMMTPFGGFKFGDCSVDYRMIVDGDGRTWTDEWAIEGAPESGCSDINECIREREELAHDRLPWKGRIRSDGQGGFKHHMDICLRTCIGMFAGEYVLRLTPGDTGTGWRIERDDAGTTGFRLNDSLAVEGDPLRIDASSPTG